MDSIHRMTLVAGDVHLNFAIDHQIGHCTNPGRWMIAKKFFEHFIEGLKIPAVGEDHFDMNHMFQAIAIKG